MSPTRVACARRSPPGVLPVRRARGCRRTSANSGREGVGGLCSGSAARLSCSPRSRASSAPRGCACFPSAGSPPASAGSGPGVQLRCADGRRGAFVFGVGVATRECAASSNRLPGHAVELATWQRKLRRVRASGVDEGLDERQPRWPSSPRTTVCGWMIVRASRQRGHHRERRTHNQRSELSNVRARDLRLQRSRTIS